MMSPILPRNVGTIRRGSNRYRTSGVTPYRHRRPVLEELEHRTLLAVSSSVAGCALLVQSDAGDDITISCVSGNVEINGANPDSGAATCASISSILVQGGPGDNDIDLSSVGSPPFSDLSPTINGGDGADTITGSRLGDSILGGGGDDLLLGGDGDDSLFGQGSDDTLTGGAGNDHIDGGSGFDLLVESGNGNFTLAAFSLVGQE